jgi:hypothetical protein
MVFGIAPTMSGEPQVYSPFQRPAHSGGPFGAPDAHAGVYDRGHIILCCLRKNPMMKCPIIPHGSETHLPPIADGAMQNPGPA